MKHQKRNTICAKKTPFTLILATMLTLSVHSAFGGDRTPQWTGNPKVDFFAQGVRLSLEFKFDLDSLTQANVKIGTEPARKSPILAGALSLVLPGSGEFYSKSYLKGGLFLAVEVAGWIVAYSYDKKGDRQTDDVFQNFADAHWSVVRYAEWINFYKNPTPNVPISNNTDAQSWERVNWEELNAAERWIQAQGGAVSYGFTHTLPSHGQQQYYELIGKYHQFSSGWDDYAGGSDFFQLSSRFLAYSDMRGQANRYYNLASAALSVVVVNHVLSAIDAYFTAASFNKSLHAEAGLRVRPTPWGQVAETVGTLTVTF